MAEQPQSKNLNVIIATVAVIAGALLAVGWYFFPNW